MGRANAAESLAIVTICRNNPRELHTTLESISVQSVAPNFQLVVDSSDSPLRGHIEKICSRFGVRYLWCEAQGVYPAMKRGLESVPSDSLVWFVNSSDYLVSENSIRGALATIRTSPPETSWWVGQVAYTGRGGPIQPVTFHNPKDFLSGLESGRIGFPHAGAIVRDSALKAVDAFADSFEIAGDYAMALRLGKKFGPPTLIDTVVAVFDRGGLSGRRPVKTAWEKSLARRRNSGRTVLEFFRFFIFGARGAGRWLVWHLRQPDGRGRLDFYPRMYEESGRDAEEAVVPLSIVTVSFNNPKELEKTLASVHKQSTRPNHHVVIDSSHSHIAPQMEQMAAQAGAMYAWVEPGGVYAAMRESLAHVPEDCYVWWLNSSDWLAGRHSVQAVVEHLSHFSPGTEPHWIVGNLIRLHEKGPTLHKRGENSKQFVTAMMGGRTGFPHPATIFRRSLLLEVQPYEDGLSIASDYATALRFAEKFGAPDYLNSTLAVHDPTGLTSRHPGKNLLEKSKARLLLDTKKQRVKEPLRLLRSLTIGVMTRLAGEQKIRRVPENLPGWPLISNEHFCDQLESHPWPECCNRLIDTLESS